MRSRRRRLASVLHVAVHPREMSRGFASAEARLESGLLFLGAAGEGVSVGHSIGSRCPMVRRVESIVPGRRVATCEPSQTCSTRSAPRYAPMTGSTKS